MAGILIVDDEDVYCRQLAWALSCDGHESKTAQDSDAALNLCQEFQPDLLIADWMLKEDASGLLLARRLREMFPGMRVVIISGFAAAHLNEVEGTTLEFVFVQKPFSISAIRQVVMRELSTVSAETPSRSKPS